MQFKQNQSQAGRNSIAKCSCCRRQHTNLYVVTVVPSFFDRVIIIGREISIFILLRGVKGGGGGDHVGNIYRTLRHAHDHSTTLPFCRSHIYQYSI